MLVNCSSKDIIMKTSEFDSNLHVNSSFQREKWCGHKFLYKFHGFWFILTYLEATQEVLENFKPLPTDVILASFPKTGTTWLKALLHSIIHRSPKDENPLIYTHPHELIPSLETDLYVPERAEGGSKNQDFFTVKDPKEVRILATHIPYQILGDVLNSCECKVVYVTRNPKDTLISFWHFLQKSQSVELDPWELEAAVDHFCKGTIPFGSYYDHVLGYREESLKRPQKVFFVTYEELKENPKNHEEVEEIVKICSFETLSNQEVNKSSELPNGFPLPYNSFFRRGEVGDHVNYLDDKMIQKIDAITREKFQGTGFVYGI
ncbi:hypothetical protein Pfo_019515 [Paulownia fortunei]|nr:hypothetical protein Pfo_019515 [Paulownia fortunei]